MYKWPLLSLLTLLIITGPAFAYEKGYYSQNAMGWHWDDTVRKKSLADEEDDSTSPEQQMNAVRATIERAKDKMVLDPNKENVKNYIVLQNQLSEKAMQVSTIWKEVLLEYPEMNFSLTHPTNKVAQQVENDLRSKQEMEAIKNFSKTSGLFFFYRSSCPYCVRFAPIVKDFAETYGITVIPITTDGVVLSEFPNSQVDKGQAEKFRVKAEPALFAVNPYTHQAFPLSYGLTSEADIKHRILQVIAGLKEGSRQ